VVQAGESNGDESRLKDKLEIIEVVHNWALWRDAGDWERFRTVWHDDGWMTATWFQGPAAKFIEVSKAGFDKGVSILHFLGGSTVDLKGNRAVAQTKMTINQRGTLDGEVVDVVCTGRFYDFFENRGERWGIVRRQPIYEKDRLDPVSPSARLSPKATGTSLICRPGSASRSSSTCRSSRAPRSRRCIVTAKPGSRARHRRFPIAERWTTASSSSSSALPSPA
jgi:hypothetical protein